MKRLGRNKSLYTTTTTTFALLAAAMLFVPAVSATGYLVNIEAGLSFKFGSNIFGGQGDTLDVGVLNHQCSDEDDFVDVGVFNREGDLSCNPTGGRCEAEEGEKPFDIALPFLSADPTDTHPHDPHCSDDGDTVDVGVFNQEGGFGRECPTQDEPGFEPHPDDPFFKGDEDDAVDVGVVNEECNDDLDANDVGVINCEWDDSNDGIDVGLWNLEWLDDSGDTFDLSLFNAEGIDGPDQNGLDLTGFPLFHGCQTFGIVGP